LMSKVLFTDPILSPTADFSVGQQRHSNYRNGSTRAAIGIQKFSCFV